MRGGSSTGPWGAPGGDVLGRLQTREEGEVKGGGGSSEGSRDSPILSFLLRYGDILGIKQALVQKASTSQWM